MKRLLFVLSVLVICSSQASADTKETYTKQCAKCHGADGKGQTVMGKKSGAKDYTDAKVQSEMKDDVAFKSLKEGMVKDGKTLMKPFELTDSEIKDLVNYVRTFKK